MKKITIILLALLMVFNLSGCIKKVESKESVNLYPAFKMEGKTRLWGYIDDSGKFIIEPKYENALEFSEEGIAQVYNDNAIGVINPKGEEIIPTRYKEITELKNGYIKAFDGEVNYVFNKEGKLQFSGNYVYIGPYSDDLFSVAKYNDNKDVLMGYVNKSGEVVVEPKYMRAYDFQNGRAVVMKDQELHQIIDKNGKELKDLEYNLVVPSTEGNIYLVRNKDNLYGYIDGEGNAIVEPKFQNGSLFEDGNAIVAVKENDSILFGVINKEGNYIIEPKYENILNLGKGYFGVANDRDRIGYKYAVVNDKGELITDFVCYDLGGSKGKIVNDFISVFDGVETYVIDLNGKKSDKLPTLEGRGDLIFDGKVAKATLLNRLYYYNSKGKLIWEESNDYLLREGAQVIEKLYQGDNGVNIYYPVVEGLKDKSAEDKINKGLYQNFVLDIEEEIAKNPDKKYKYYNTTYVAKKFHDLLTIQKYSEFYADGENTKGDDGAVFNISLINGKFFTLKDLFKKDVDYLTTLSNLIGEEMGMRIMEGSGIYKVDNFQGIREDQDFIPYIDRLGIFFRPSELISYTETFPTFSITHDSISDILDMESEFWWTYEVNRGF